MCTPPNRVTLSPSGNSALRRLSWETIPEKASFIIVISRTREYRYQVIIAKGGYKHAWHLRRRCIGEASRAVLG